MGEANREEGLVQEQHWAQQGVCSGLDGRRAKTLSGLEQRAQAGGPWGEQAGPPGGRLGMPGGAPGLRPTGQRSADQGPRPAEPRPVQRLVLHGPEAKDGLYTRQWLLKENQSHSIL